MKKVLFTAMALLAFSLQLAYAQESDAFKEDTITFLKLTGATSAFDNAIAQLGAGVPEANKMAYVTEANETLDGLYGKMADIYMEEFTHDEVKKLIDFYNSDLGKKVAEKQMVLMQRAMPMGQAWAGELQQLAQKYSQ